MWKLCVQLIEISPVRDVLRFNISRERKEALYTIRRLKIFVPR